ncbi:MAG: hypothetical protein HYV04_12675 [Deltaproteobacteria bacterium]|nr:hypothetical protein [Deltaproteobacteria bacterium]
MKIKIMIITAIGLMLRFFPLTPVWAGDLDERIEALEREVARVKPLEEALARLKAEQVQTRDEQIELKNEATAAAAALPRFTYRPGAGLLMEDANGAWGIRSFMQMQYFSTFWLDDNRPKNGAIQGAIHPRRLRPRFNYYWDRGFHEFDFWVDINNSASTTGGPWQAFKANYAAHFEQISPFLPTLWVGANPSFWMNASDINVSSLTGGRTEFSLLSQGNGIVLGTQTRGVVLDWTNVPLGSARGQLHLGYSIFNRDAFAQLSNVGFKNDGKAFAWGVGVEPFANIKNPWLQRLELSFGGLVNVIPTDNFPAIAIRTQQTRAQRVTMIATSARDGFWQYYTPGVNWTFGPYTVRASGQFDNSERETGSRVNSEGNQIKSRGWRIINELFVWSPKGFLTGSPRERGSVMISPLFDRVDVRAPNAMSGCGGCQGAYAINSGLALWYFTGIAGTPTNVGVVWDHWRVNKANTDVATSIEKGTEGRAVNWNTLTLVLRTTW